MYLIVLCFVFFITQTIPHTILGDYAITMPNKLVKESKKKDQEPLIWIWANQRDPDDPKIIEKKREGQSLSDDLEKKSKNETSSAQT